jgi:hypothetical protein
MHSHNLLSVHYRAVIYPNMDLRFLVMLLWLGCSIECFLNFVNFPNYWSPLYDQKKSRESFYDDIDFMLHLITDTIDGPSAIWGGLFLNIPHMGLNGVGVGQTQTSGKPQV